MRCSMGAAANGMLHPLNGHRAGGILRFKIVLGTASHVVNNQLLFLFPLSTTYLLGNLVLHEITPDTRYRHHDLV